VCRCGVVVDRCGVVVGRCESLWVVVGRCGSLWIVVGHCESLWVVPCFSNYGLRFYISNFDILVHVLMYPNSISYAFLGIIFVTFRKHAYGIKKH
jgi:hypothetical protein